MSFGELFGIIAVLALIGALYWAWKERKTGSEEVEFAPTQAPEDPDQEVQRDGGPKIRV